MKQKLSTSAWEALVSIAVGFGLSLLLQWLFFVVWLGLPLSAFDNLTFTVIMTAASFLRQMGVRRLFEALHIRIPMSPGTAAVIAERNRQQTVECWSAEHDAGHERGVLAKAGAIYALWANIDHSSRVSGPPRVPPAGLLWEREWWKPADFRRNLIKAAALILAEIDKFDRERKRRSN